MFGIGLSTARELPGVDVTEALAAASWGAQPDGLNASIGTTAVLLALILPLVRPRAK